MFPRGTKPDGARGNNQESDCAGAIVAGEKHPKAKYLAAVSDLLSILIIMQSTLPNAPFYPLQQGKR